MKLSTVSPQVYGACIICSKRNDELKKMGFADSKTLTEEKREVLFEQIKESEVLGWLVDVLSAKQLSGSMLQRSPLSTPLPCPYLVRRAPHNLNAISHDSAIGLIRKVLAANFNLKKVFVDTVGDPERYESKLSSLFPSIEFAVRKKADSLFPVVSAASICAKVTRDRCVREWQFAETGVSFSTDYGSGYPSGYDSLNATRVAEGILQTRLRKYGWRIIATRCLTKALVAGR
eukprot:754085-Hanusia_phi.AAC.2